MLLYCIAVDELVVRPRICCGVQDRYGSGYSLDESGLKVVPLSPVGSALRCCRYEMYGVAEIGL